VDEVERELKLTAESSFAMPALDDLDGGLRTIPWAPEPVWTVYYDTSDLRLARWNASLRHRLGQGWTVKLPPQREGGVVVRSELVFPGDGKRPPAGAVDLVRAFTRGAPLQASVRLWTTRRRTELRDGEGHLVADVFEDDVTVRDGRQAVQGFKEIEVEVSEATPAGLVASLTDRFESAGADSSDPLSKYVRALGAHEVAPEVPVHDLSEDASMGDVVRRAIAASVTRLIAHDPVMRLDTDPEGVHQARVATRRLRSDLVTFADVVEAGHAAQLRDELGWLAGILGAVRDGDVMLDRTTKLAARLDEAHARGAAEVISSLSAERDRAHATLLTTLREPRYLRLLDSLVAEANAPSLVPEAAALPAAATVGGLARAPWKALRRQRKRLGKKPRNADLHLLRIRAKRLRYAAEAVAPVVGKEAKALAAAAADLQGVLGDLNDAVVAKRWLREWAADEGRSDAGRAAAGELVRLERADAERLRSEWRPVWKRLSEPALRSWL
jgi:CHAD domain-containing protein